MSNVLPARFAIFAALAAAVLAATWFERARGWRRTVVGALVAIAAVPNFWLSSTVPNAWSTPYPAAWSTAAPAAGFVAAQRWQTAVRRGANVLVLPTGDRTDAQWWQAETGMRFGLTVPGSPFIPPALAANPTVVGLFDNVLPQLDGPALGAARLRSFILRRRVDDVVVTPAARRQWLTLTRRAVPSSPVDLDGSLVFVVPHRLAPLRVRVPVHVSGDPRLRVWLAFNGRSGSVLARVGTHATVDLSPPGDTSSITPVVGQRGRAAVGFVQDSGAHQIVEVAVYASSRWHVDTVGRNSGPIWSQRVGVAPDGTFVTGWIDENGADRRLLFARTTRDLAWTAPTQLDAGDGLGSFAFAHKKVDASVVWHDTVADERRLLRARLVAGHWISGGG